MRNFSIGVIGCGGIAHDVHLPLLSALPEFSVAWTCDLDGVRARATARRFSVEGAYEDLAACPDVDAVIIATPVGSRATILNTVARRGWHAFCEKPFARTSVEHQSMLQTAGANGIVLSCGYMRRYYQSSNVVSDLLKCIPSGTPVSVLASDCQRVRRNPHSNGWYLMDSAQSGGGFLMETGSHVIDQALRLVGGAQIDVGSAQQVHVGEIEYETTACARVETNEGRTISFEIAISRLRDLWSGIRISTPALHVDIGLYPGSPVTLTNRDSESTTEIPSALSPGNDLINAFIGQLITFAERARSCDWTTNAEETGLTTTACLTQCYGKAAKKTLSATVN